MFEREKSTTAVFVIARPAVIRAGLSALVESDEQFRLAGSRANFAALPDFITNQETDVILVYLEEKTDFAELSELLSAISEEEKFPPIVVLFAPDLQGDEILAKSLRLGIKAILPRDSAEKQIFAALKAAAENLFVLTEEMINSILPEVKAVGELKDELETEMIEPLTPRELEVLELLADGASNKIIAYRLNISEHTVKFHVSSIFAKLNVTTRTEAVTQALRRALILL